MKYSKNTKLNTVLNQIEGNLLQFGKDEIKCYMEEFPNEPDYSIADYGNMLVYYWKIRKMYINAGYKTFENNKISDFKMCEIYKRQVGYVARQIMKTA